MHNTIDYSKSLAKHFDAVEDVKDWFGDRWSTVSPLMGQIKDPVQFEAWAGFAGVSGFPVEAWYELYHGGGSWAKALAEKEAPTNG